MPSALHESEIGNIAKLTIIRTGVAASLCRGVFGQNRNRTATECHGYTYKFLRNVQIILCLAIIGFSICFLNPKTIFVHL